MSEQTLLSPAGVVAGPPGRQRRHAADMTFVKFLACILIFNSHLEAFYPRAWMAGDGMLGVYLFFFLSGAGLALSSRTRSLSFGRWYLRRIARVYPTAILASLVTIAAVLLFVHAGDSDARPLLSGADGQQHSASVTAKYPYLDTSIPRSPEQVFHYFIWPTTYGFIGAIMVYYAIAFPFLRNKLQLGLLVSVVASAWLLAYVYFVRTRSGTLFIGADTVPWWFHWGAGLVAMGAGGLVGLERDTALNKRALMSAVLLTMCFVLYIVVKWEVVVRHVEDELYVFLPVLALLFCIFSYVSFTNSRFLTRIAHLGIVWVLAQVIADLTLEIYTLHFMVISLLGLEHLVFPINIATAFAISVFAALGAKKLIAACRARCPRLSVEEGVWQGCRARP